MHVSDSQNLSRCRLRTSNTLATCPWARGFVVGVPALILGIGVWSL